jgi:hypothetical protein
LLSDYIRTPQENALSYVANALYSPFVGLSQDELADARARSFCDFSASLPHHVWDAPGDDFMPGYSPLSRIDADILRLHMPAVGGVPKRGRLPASVHRPSPALRIEVPEIEAWPQLGTNTNFAAKLQKQNAKAYETERYALQEVARKLLPLHRIAVCLRSRVDVGENVRVLHSVKNKSGFLGNVMRCGAVWVCAFCAAKKAEERRKELDQAVTQWSAAGRAVYMASLTFSHHKFDDLQTMLDAALGAFRKMTAHRSYKDFKGVNKIEHVVRALEVTWYFDNGWHPHFHVLFFSGDSVPDTDAGARALEKTLTLDLFASWSLELERVGLSASEKHGVKVQVTKGAIADYVAKWGHPPTTKEVWGVASEATKGHVKEARAGRGFTPFDLLRNVADSGDFDSEFAQRFQEFATAFHGKNQLVWSRGMRDAFGLGADSDEVAEPEDVQLVGEIFPHEWDAVLEHRAQPAVLAFGAANDRAGLVAFIEQLVHVRPSLRVKTSGYRHRLDLKI